MDKIAIWEQIITYTQSSTFHPHVSPQGERGFYMGLKGVFNKLTVPITTTDLKIYTIDIDKDSFSEQKSH